jgi:hypothetical protein
MTLITTYRGDDKTLNLTFTNSSGAAIDITGYSIFFTVKNISDVTTDDSLAIISKTVTSHTDAAAGLTSISLTNSDTNITINTYKYDIQSKDGSGNINTILTGNFIINNDVTKRTS